MSEPLDILSVAQDLERALGPKQPKKKPKRSSIRADLAELLGDSIAIDMAASIRAALDSMKTEWIECDHCRHKVPFSLPNMYERVKAAQLVMSELEGKVGTHREAPAVQKNVTGDLADLTDEQLVALLSDNDEPPEDEDAD